MNNKMVTLMWSWSYIWNCHPAVTCDSEFRPWFKPALYLDLPHTNQLIWSDMIQFYLLPNMCMFHLFLFHSTLYYMIFQFLQVVFNVIVCKSLSSTHWTSIFIYIGYLILNKYYCYLSNQSSVEHIVWFNYR